MAWFKGGSRKESLNAMEIVEFIDVIVCRCHVFGLRRWNRDCMTIGKAWAQDRRAVRDAVVAMDAGATAPR